MSGIEPSLQPSFIFPSRKLNADYAKGLIDISSATQRTLVVPSAPTNIDIVTALETPLTRPPVLDKEVFDVKGVLPVDTPIYVQPGRAEGMMDVAKLTLSDAEITKITSANNAMKRGNYKAAEAVIGREATTEELANHTFTPNLRTSEATPGMKQHYSFDRNTSGERILAKNETNLQTKIFRTRNADERLVNDIAQRLNIPGAMARDLKTKLGYTGDTVLGYEKSSAQDQRDILDTVDLFYRQTLGKSPAARAEALNEASILQGERPLHSGRKALEGLRRYREQFAKEHPGANINFGPFQTGTEQPEDYLRQRAMDDDYEAWNDVYENERKMEERERFNQSERERNARADANRYFQWDHKMEDDADEKDEKYDIPMAPGPPESAFRRYNSRPTSNEEKDYYNENPFQGAPRTTDELLRRPLMLENKEEDGDLILNSQAIGVTQVNVPLPSEDELMHARSGLKKRGYEQVVADAPYGPMTFTDAYENELTDEISKKAKQRHQERKDDDLAVDLLETVGRRVKTANDAAIREAYAEVLKRRAHIEMNNERRRNGLPPVLYHERLQNIPEEKEGDEEMGAGIGGRRRKRTLKRQPFRPSQMPSKNFLPDTDSLSNRGGVVSGRLMEQTGQNAVPISAQIQVQETHQYDETPLQEWVRHPNYESVDRPDLIPIPQYVGNKGVGKRAKKLKFGGYMLDHNKLLTQSVLSLSHPSGKKVKGMPNMEVTPALKNVVHSIVTGGKVSTRGLKAQEKLFLKELLHRSAANVDIGADVNVAPSEQLSLILGEIDAGNDSPDLKRQLKKLMPSLVKSKTITRDQMQDISHHYL